MKKLKIIFYTIFASIWFMVPMPASSNLGTDSPRELLRSWLQPAIRTSSPLPPGRSEFAPLNTLARFYKQRHYQLAWIDRQGLSLQGELLLKVLGNAAVDGLNPVEYQIKPWEPVIKNVMSSGTIENHGFWEEIARLDISLTQSFLKYTSDLQKGRLHPDAYTVAKGPEFDLSPEIISLGLMTAADSGRLEAFFQGLSPRHKAYQTLKTYLDRYETIRRLGGWKQIPNGAVLKQGVRSPRLPLLNERLLMTGDLPLAHFSTREQFTAPLEEAVKRYQHRNGMTADGIVGKKTLEGLNIPVEHRIAQLKLNMERWRWLPPNLGTQHLMVNVPGFELKIIQNHAEQKSMRVIVGRKKRQTPILTSKLTYLELNPYWNIPQTIARKDILPKIQSDPLYLSKNSIQVFDGWKRNAPMIDPTHIDWQGFSNKYLPYRLRQDPAPHNALGRVKFMFPNHHSIYIHDTPGKSLFDKEVRIFSSGCVRLENPLELAHLLLKNQQWDYQRINKVINAKKRKTIVMKQPVPVHLVYFTSWVDKNDTVHFRQDIYDRDKRLLAALTPKASARKLWCSNDTRPWGEFRIDGRDLCNLVEKQPQTGSRL